MNCLKDSDNIMSKRGHLEFSPRSKLSTALFSVVIGTPRADYMDEYAEDAYAPNPGNAGDDEPQDSNDYSAVINLSQTRYE